MIMNRLPQRPKVLVKKSLRLYSDRHNYLDSNLSQDGVQKIFEKENICWFLSEAVCDRQTMLTPYRAGFKMTIDRIWQIHKYLRQ